MCCVCVGVCTVNSGSKASCICGGEENKKPHVTTKRNRQGGNCVEHSQIRRNLGKTDDVGSEKTECTGTKTGVSSVVVQAYL